MQSGSHLKSGTPAVRGTAAVCPPPERNFLGNQFVYSVLSQRARGLSIGINMNPDRRCNFDCVYCEVDHTHRKGSGKVKINVMLAELQKFLEIFHSGRLRDLCYQNAPDELLQLREVVLSGDGEPTHCPNFLEVTEAVIRLRAQRMFPFFKLVLITNATGLRLPAVEEGIRLFTPTDEVWAKLDAGTQAYMDVVNRPDGTIAEVLANILYIGRKRPIIIQSLFPLINGVEPSEQEIDAYATRIRELREAGAQIAQVQVYSAHRPAVDIQCAHMPLRSLSRIARRVRDISGVNAEVF